MRLLIQRVSEAEVSVEGDIAGEIGEGLLVFVGLGAGDSEAQFAPAAEKLLNLRIFSDEAGRMNRSLAEIGGGLLLVSQFTLYGDVRKGRRPSWSAAMPPADAEKLYVQFVDYMRKTHTGRVQDGRFGAHMRVELVNDGPVTIWIDSAEMKWD